nr:tetratricopeptide repeat protein [Snodgrassella gandavensis]
MGAMYKDGEKTAQDYSEAYKYYKLAAEQGNIDAQFSLGCMYRSGKGVMLDLAKAVYYYQQAAVQGNLAAQYNNLWLMYYNGYGVKKISVLPENF